MSADDLNKQQTRDGNTADDKVENTPAANVTAVNVNTAAFEEQEPGPFFCAEQPESAEEDSISHLLRTGPTTRRGKRPGKTPMESLLANTKNSGDLPPIEGP
ncbi:hypothetical protein F2Q69_00028767 [Brassica cretica]|uniref:Uncharacterized protein n=1 Tax=Brassica cretica TaxID=69181 RepID=A0A8S9RVN7_BRACR|nr:hypothetical protein F2Q69_00028767 [Brassica cretica]